MGCNRTPTTKEAKEINEAASRIVSELGGADSARAASLVALYGEIRAKMILREERQSFQQPWTNPTSSSSGVSNVTSQTPTFSFEQPVWTSSEKWSTSFEQNVWTSSEKWETLTPDASKQRMSSEPAYFLNHEWFNNAISGTYQSTKNDQGCVVNIQGWLSLAKGESPKTDGISGKDRGHLIGKQFGGMGDHTNIVNIDPRINRSFLNAYEGCIAEHIKNGKEIYMQVRVDYGKNGEACAFYYDLFMRGTGFHSTMKIDPNTYREFTLKQGLKGSGWTVKEFVDPFLRKDYVVQ